MLKGGERWWGHMLNIQFHASVFNEDARMHLDASRTFVWNGVGNRPKCLSNLGWAKTNENNFEFQHLQHLQHRQHAKSKHLWCLSSGHEVLYMANSLQTDCCCCYPPSWVHWKTAKKYIVVVRLKLWLQIMVLARGLGRERVLEYAGIFWAIFMWAPCGHHVGTMWAPWHVPSSSLQIPHISGWGPWSCFAPTRAWQELREQGESKVSLCFFLGKLDFLQLVLRWLDIGQGEREVFYGFLSFLHHVTYVYDPMTSPNRWNTNME